MYKVKYKNGTECLIPVAKGDRLLLLQKQGMFNARQTKWYETVESVTKLRGEVDHRTILKTKDMKCSCLLCY